MNELTNANKNNIALYKTSKAMEFCDVILTKKKSIAQIEAELKIVDVLDKPILKHIFRGDNKRKGMITLKSIITNFLNNFGFSAKASEDMIITMTYDIFEEFSHETLEDVIIFLKMVRKGKFGETNRGMDSNLLIGKYLPMYLEQKSITRQAEYEKRKKKESAKETIDAETIQRHYAKAKRNRDDLATKWMEEESKNWDREMLENIITSWQKSKLYQPYVKQLKEYRMKLKN